MVDGVFPGPMIIRGKSQDAGQEPDRVVGQLGFEKGAMPAVVENNEDADEKSAGQGRQGDRDPPRNGKTPVHQTPKSDIGNDSVDDLPERAPGGWLLIFGHERLPSKNLGAPFVLPRKRIVCHKVTSRSRAIVDTIVELRDLVEQVMFRPGLRPRKTAVVFRANQAILLPIIGLFCSVRCVVDRLAEIPQR